MAEVEKAIISRGESATAASLGVREATIKMLGRWLSAAYQVYIKTPREYLDKFSSVLSGEPPKCQTIVSSASQPENKGE